MAAMAICYMLAPGSEHRGQLMCCWLKLSRAAPPLVMLQMAYKGYLAVVCYEGK